LTVHDVALGTEPTPAGRPLALANLNLSATLDSVNSTSSTGGPAIGLTNVQGTLAIPSTSSAITNPLNEAVLVSNSAPNFTYAGSITKTSGGTGIAVSGNNAGTLTFSGALALQSATSDPAVNMLNNTGTTVAFSGSLHIASTATGDGLDATGGGSVTVTGSNNTISTQTGTALNVGASGAGNPTTIGAAGMQFVSISAGTLSTGPQNGILLNNTGTTGQLTVTGLGTTANSGGIIQHTAGAAVSLISAVNVKLQLMTIDTSGATGISMTASAGTSPTLDIETSTIQNAVGSGLSVDVRGTGTATVTVNASTFANNHDGVMLDAHDTATTTATLTGNTLTSNQDGVVCLNDGNNLSSTTCNISNNTLTGQTVGSIVLRNGSAAPCVGGTLVARIQTNSATQTVTGISSVTGTAAVIGVAMSGCNSVTQVLLDSNIVGNNGAGAGIDINTPGAGTTPNAGIQVSRNQVTMSPNGLNAIDVEVAQGTTSTLACLRIGSVAGGAAAGNTATGVAAGNNAILLSRTAPARVQLEMGAVASAEPGMVLRGNNPASSPVSVFPPTNSGIDVVPNGTAGNPQCVTP
jgi:hypothetical protein